ncbi:MAG: hypothetical protein KGY61_13075 [Desulfobacterales bacterium]|nr:hypothetical protein [Desulfobacterales bacterium]
MAESYYYMWEFVTSMTIIILVAAYIIHDRIKLRYQKLEEAESQRKINWLNGVTMTILGILAVLGGGSWVAYVLTHKIYISPELEGFHSKVPGLLMALIGLVVLVAGLRKYLNPEPDGSKEKQ